MRKVQLSGVDTGLSLVQAGETLCINTDSEQQCESRFPSDAGDSMKLVILCALFGLGLAQHNPHTKHGRTAIVHLFEWRWADIAAECERFLAPNGFGGVQVCLVESRE